MRTIPSNLLVNTLSFAKEQIPSSKWDGEDLVSLILLSGEVGDAGFTVPAPASGAHAPELLDFAAKVLEMRLPTIALLSRQARARRGRIYFRYLRAAWSSLLRDQDGIAGTCGKDGDWAGYLHTRWHCLCIHGHLAALSFSGLRYLLWSQQGARGVRRMRYHAARIGKLSMQA